ncbi:MAG: hypothetical protein ABSC56_05410 [Solirubrobacteraceae bacterium]|jgi:Tfp pilus assembly protein PilX
MLVGIRRPPARDGEGGFSLIVAIVVLAASSLLLFAAIDAITYGSGTTRSDLDQKRALLAAEAGLSAYEQALNNNPNYWETCPGPGGATGVTSVTGVTGTTVPGSTDSGSTETYRYANLEATGVTTGCSAASPISSMVQQSGAAAGTFRVEVTGTSGPTTGNAAASISRSIVAQFQPASFLNYVYFTNYEDEDPAYAGGSETPALCDVYAWAGRSATTCPPIYFASGDSVNGPMHSNDDVAVCGAPTFGRQASDAIETPNNPVTEANGSCTGPVHLVGTWNASAGTLPLPADDTQLLQVADGNNGTLAGTSTCPITGAGCVFSGPTTIVLDGPTSGTNYMTVTNSLFNGGTATKVAFPSNGVVYVNGSYCTYTPFGTENQLYGGTTLDTTSGDTDNAGCGDAVVSDNPSTSSCTGTTQVSGVCPYTQSLTIGSSNDIILAGNITTTTTTSACPGGASNCPSGTALLGLVANDYVRVFHPLGSARNTNDAAFSCLAGVTGGGGNTNGTGSLINPVIDAGILAVNHSFIVDNYDCGLTSDTAKSGGGYPLTALGSLTVNGAIAQNFRGPVGTLNPDSTPGTGYSKNYNYDQRFLALEPPYFLNPVNAGWSVDRITECGTSC